MLMVTIRRVEKLQYLRRRFRNEPFRTRATAWVDNNERIPTRVDEDGDRCPVWDQTLRVPFDGPIRDDTTLCIDISDNREDGTEEVLGSAKLKLKKVEKAVGYGALFKKTLKLMRHAPWSHGDLVVEVLIVQPGTALPEEQPPRKSMEFVKTVAKTVATGLTAAAGISAIVGSALDNETD